MQPDDFYLTELSERDQIWQEETLGETSRQIENEDKCKLGMMAPTYNRSTQRLRQSQVPVAHAYNPSYSGGQDQKDHN
jgi:hypothetical protein